MKHSTFEKYFLGGSLVAPEWSTELDIETTSSFKVIFLHRPSGGVVAAAQATVGPVPMSKVPSCLYEALDF